MLCRLLILYFAKLYSALFFSACLFLELGFVPLPALLVLQLGLFQFEVPDEPLLHLLHILPSSHCDLGPGSGVLPFLSSGFEVRFFEV